MPDDIVERLWGSIPGDPDYVLDLISDAANEILRLRRAGNALVAALRAETVNGAMAVCEGTNEAIEAWEARRG